MKTIRFTRVLAILCFVFSQVGSAFASIADSAGFGSRTAALGGAGVSWGFDAYAAYYNPAGLAIQSESRTSLSLGMVYLKPSFTNIDNVVLQNSFNSDTPTESPIYGSADTAYRSTFGQTLGVSYHLFPEFRNLSLGVVTFFPLQQLAYMDSGEAYAPEYVMYRARTQRPQIEVGVGAELGNGFYFGSGLHIAYTLTSNAPVFINTEETSISSMRFTSSLKPKAAPYFGLLYVSKNNSRPSTVGAVLRFPVSFDNVMTLTSSARLFGKNAAFDFSFLAVSSLYYDPLTVEFGGSLPLGDRVRVYSQLDYQNWSRFKIPAILFEQSGGPKVSSGPVPDFQFSNTWTPRIGTEISLSSRTSLRFGYAFHPTLLKAVGSGSGNYLDPPKHMLGVGFGWELNQLFGSQTPTRFDFHLAYQHLNTQQITKSGGNEAGEAKDQKIGAPGYQAGGNIFGGGVSLSLAF